MEIPFITPDISSLKSFEINNEGKKYICKIELMEELIQAYLFSDNKIKYKGNIFLEKIQSQIKAFFDFNINEIFEEINQLNTNNFSIIKEKNKYKLKIEFMILRKKRYIIIDLNENKIKDDKMNDIIKNYEKIIEEKDNKIIELKEKIKELEKLLNKKVKEKTDNNNDNLYNNFNIQIKKSIYKINIHKDSVFCLSLLNDGRLVSGSADKHIIIYNKLTFQPDIIIKEHNDYIRCIIQLSSGELASCSSDKTIKIFKIKGNNYQILQTLNYHTKEVFQIIEMKNKYLASCSGDKSIIFYLKNNSKYEKYYNISANGRCYSIIQSKENEICYSERVNYDNFNIYFHNINEKTINSSISNISSSGLFGSFNMITKDLLIIGGKNKISIINVNEYKLIRVIETNSSINGFCMFNESIFLTGCSNGIIKQWKIEGDNLNLISQKEKAHNDDICVLIKIGDGHIATASYDKLIKIW